MKNIIFIPGSFSPFHDGHYSMISEFISDNNEIHIIVSSKNRDNINTDNIVSFINKIFEKYNNVIVHKVDISPIKWIYENTIENDDVTYTMIRSAKNNDDKITQDYIKAFSPNGIFYNKHIHINEINKQILPISYNQFHDSDYISGTHVRSDIKNKNKDAFFGAYNKILENNNLLYTDILNIFENTY